MKVILDNFKLLKTPIFPEIKHLNETINYTQSLKYRATIKDISIECEIPVFPIFYHIDEVTLNTDTELEISLDNIDLKKKGFNCLDAKGLKINEVFSLEQFLLSYLITINHNSIKNLNFTDIHCQYNDLAISQSSQRDRVIKYKIGRDSALRENRHLKELIQQGNTIRLDGNKMLSEMSLLHILDDVDLKKIEYIEEPFENINTWNNFIDNNPTYQDLHFALDESYEEYQHSLEQIKNLKHMIIKPSRDLSISGVLRLKDKRPDINIVISSSFENEISLNTLIFLGSLFNNYHGLGTYHYMSDSFTRITADSNNQIINGYPFQLNQI